MVSAQYFVTSFVVRYNTVKQTIFPPLTGCAAYASEQSRPYVRRFSGRGLFCSLFTNGVRVKQVVLWTENVRRYFRRIIFTFSPPELNPVCRTCTNNNQEILLLLLRFFAIFESWQCKAFPWKHIGWRFKNRFKDKGSRFQVRGKSSAPRSGNNRPSMFKHFPTKREIRIGFHSLWHRLTIKVCTRKNTRDRVYYNVPIEIKFTNELVLFINFSVWRVRNRTKYDLILESRRTNSLFSTNF